MKGSGTGAVEIVRVYDGSGLVSRALKWGACGREDTYLDYRKIPMVFGPGALCKDVPVGIFESTAKIYILAAGDEVADAVLAAVPVSRKESVEIIGDLKAAAPGERGIAVNPTLKKVSGQVGGERIDLPLRQERFSYYAVVADPAAQPAKKKSRIRIKGVSVNPRGVFELDLGK